jgi:hypothetical protein
LWRGPLRERWVGRPALIAGLTTYSDFALLRTSAREDGFALLQEGMHALRDDIGIEHTLRFRSDGADVAATCAQAGPNWASALVMALCTGSLSASMRREVVITPLDRRHEFRPALLISWAFASKATL